MELSDEQRDIVFDPTHTIFVAAGAGSGKTRVLTERFVALLAGEGEHEACDLDGVIAVTYTEKAAGELIERIRERLAARGLLEMARDVHGAWISTIHGMCARLLRRHAPRLGLDPRFEILPEEEAAILRHEAFEFAASRLQEDPVIDRLLDAWHIEDLEGDVIRIHEGVRTRGCSLDALGPASSIKAREARHIASELRALAKEARAFNTSESSLQNACEMERVAAVLNRPGVLGDPNLAEEALIEVASATVTKSVGQDAKEIAERGEEYVKRALQVLTDAVARHYEAAFVRLTEAYADAYGKLKDERACLDFHDLELKALELLTREPDIASRYRANIRELMIDEFQDANQLQLRLARAIAGPALITVGDERQSIYRFRFADVEVFREEARRAANRRALKDNYRSHPDVLHAVNAIFSSSELFGPDFMRLEPRRAGGPTWPEGECRVSLLLVETPRSSKVADRRELEAAALAERFAALRAGGVAQGDMVVLLRKMKDVAPVFEWALRARGFDVRVASGEPLFATPEVQHVLDVLRVIDNPRDDEALLRTLASPMVCLSDTSLYALRSATGRQCTLWDTIREGVAAVDDDDRATLDAFRDLIERARRRRGTRRIGSLIILACEALGYDLVLWSRGPEGERAWANIMRLVSTAERFEQRQPMRLGAFLRYVDERARRGDERVAAEVGAVDAIRIMSVHAAKGLEFPVVAVADLGPAGKPHVPSALVSRGDPPTLAVRIPGVATKKGKALGSSAHVTLAADDARQDEEEELRLLYVACTRAREALIVSGCLDASEDETTSRIGLIARIVGGGAWPAPGIHRLGEAAIAVHRITPDEIGSPTCGSASPVVAVGDLTVERAQPTPPRVHRSAATRTDTGAPGRQPLVLSFSSLAMHEACTLKFHAIRELRMGPCIASRRASSTAFGTAAHQALALVVRGELDAGRLHAIAQHVRLDETDEQRLERVVEAYRTSLIPERLAAAAHVEPEHAFAVTLDGAVLIGAMDVLARLEGEALIVDFKTGRGGKDAARDARHENQARCYALAALREGAARVEALFVELERGGDVERFTFDAADERAIEDELNERVRRIRNEPPKPLGRYAPDVCGDCPALGGLCPVEPPRRRSR